MRAFRVNRSILLLGTSLAASGGFTLAEENTDTAPSFSINPALTGTKEVGATLTLSNGTFAGDPTPDVIARVWQYSDDGSGSPDGTISGQTGSTYAVSETYEGKYIRGGVTIDNGVGSPVTAYSAWYGPIEETSEPLWPTQHNTGIPPGTTLTNYSGPTTISTNGTVIEDKIIDGTITVEADNVIIRRCRITMDGHYGIMQMGGSNLLVEDCEIRGVEAHSMRGIAISGGTLRRCNIHGMVLGVVIWDTSTIEYNYVHDLAETSSDPDDRHFDCVACYGGASNSIIRNNALIAPNPNGGTACVFLSSQQFAMTGTQVTDNLMMGDASFAAYAEEASYPMSGIVYDGNYIEHGIYGYIYNNSGATDTNNVKFPKNSRPSEVQAWLDAIAA